MFRLTRNDDAEQPVVNVEIAAQIEPETRGLPPGRWHLDELAAKPSPSGHTARRRGVGLKRADWSVAIEPDPWS
jgi:hypothetical protein